MRASGIRDRFQALEPDRQGYLLQSLAHHLRESGNHERLYALMSQDWMDLKLQATGSHRSFAGDVNLIVEAAMASRPPDIARTAAASVIAARLGSQANSVPAVILIALARLGQPARAESYADLARDPVQRAQAYRGIARILHEHGDADRAHELDRKAGAVEAKAIASGMHPTDKLLASIRSGDKAALSAYYQSLGEAGPSLEEADAPEARARSALDLVAGGQYERALAIARDLDPGQVRDQVMSGVDDRDAGYYAMDYGFAIARLEARTADARHAVLTAIVTTLAESADLADIERTLTATEDIQEPDDQELTLEHTAVALLAPLSNQVPTAEQNAGSHTTDPTRQQRYLAELAVSLARVGQFGSYRQVMSSVTHPSARMEAHVRVVSSFIEMGQPQRALAFLREIEIEEGRLAAWQVSLHAVTAVSRPEDVPLADYAAASATYIFNVFSRIQAFKEIGVAYARAGALKQAVAIVERIRASPGTTPPDPSNAENLLLTCYTAEAAVRSVVCQALARQRHFTDALTMVQAIHPRALTASNTEGIVTALGVLAEELARAGEAARLDHVASTVPELTSEWDRPAALAAVSRGFALKGDFDRALSIVDCDEKSARLDHAQEKAKAYVAVAAFSQDQMHYGLHLLDQLCHSDPAICADAVVAIAADLTRPNAILLPNLIATVARLNDNDNYRPAALGRLTAVAARISELSTLTLALDAIKDLAFETHRAEALALAVGPIIQYNGSQYVELIAPSRFAIRLPALRTQIMEQICNALVARDESDIAIELWAREFTSLMGGPLDALYILLAAVSSSLAPIDHGRMVWAVRLGVQEVEPLRLGMPTHPT